jgi:glycosyltransferase involved in cell wall biosynthesis
MKKVLMLCFFFPPIGGAGTQRSSKFVKHLPQAGWLPTVIGGIDPTWPQDRTLLADIPEGVHVHRFPVPVSVWRRARDWMFTHWLGPVGWGHVGTRLGHFLDFPDSQREWADTAAKLALHLKEYEQFDVIYTTVPPYSLCTAIRRIQQELALPWVADFRDPWFTEDMDIGLQPGWVRQRHGRAERDTVLHADAIVCAHPDLVGYFTKTYGFPEERCHLIYNGFDQDDYSQWPPCRIGTRRKFTITHTGTLYRNYNADALARALRDHWTGPPAGVDEVEIRFVGGAAETKFEQRPGLTVTVTPRGEHDVALREQANADALLAVFDRRVYAGHIPGKLFEYLASRRPILGILPSNGAMAEIIRDCRAGWIVDCDRPREIVETIHQMVRTLTQAGFRFEPDGERISRFSRSVLTHTLATVFDRVVKNFPDAKASRISF